MALGFVPGRPPCSPELWGSPRPEEARSKGLHLGLGHAVGLDQTVKRQGRAQAFRGDSVHTGEPGGTGQQKQTVLMGDQQALGLAPSLSRGETGGEWCLRKINLRGAWVA